MSNELKKNDKNELNNKESWQNKQNTMSRFAKQDFYFIIRQEINHTHCSLTSKGQKRVDLMHGDVLDKNLDRQVQDFRNQKKIDDEENNQVPWDEKYTQIEQTLYANTDKEQVHPNPPQKKTNLAQTIQKQQLFKSKSADSLKIKNQSVQNDKNTDAQSKYCVSSQQLDLAKKGMINKEEQIELEESYLKRRQALQEKVLLKQGRVGQEGAEARRDALDEKMLQRHQSASLLDLVHLASSPLRPSPALPAKSLRHPTHRSLAHLSATPGPSFNSAKFSSKFHNLGKEIMSMESKAKKFAKVVGKNQSNCEQLQAQMGHNLWGDSKLLSFAEVVRNMQHIDKELLINDLMDVQKYKEHSVNYKLMDIDKERIRKAQEDQIDQLLFGTTKIHVMISTDTLDNIKSDVLSNDELNLLDLQVFQCMEQQNLGFITKKDLSLAESKQREKLNDINNEIKSSKRTYESERLEKGQIQPDQRNQMKESQLTASKEPTTPNYMLKVNVAGKTDIQDQEKLAKVLTEAFSPEKESREPRKGQIRQSNKQVSRKDLETLGLDPNLCVEMNKINMDQDYNKYKGIRGHIFQNRNAKNQIVVDKPKPKLKKIGSNKAMPETEDQLNWDRRWGMEKPREFQDVTRTIFKNQPTIHLTELRIKLLNKNMGLNQVDTYLNHITKHQIDQLNQDLNGQVQLK